MYVSSACLAYHQHSVERLIKYQKEYKITAGHSLVIVQKTKIRL